MIRIFRGATVLLGLLAAACATKGTDGRWEHPTRTADERAADYADCRSEATKKVERELGRTGPSYVERTQTELQAKLSQFSATKRRDELVESCMRRRGYTRPTGKEDTDNE